MFAFISLLNDLSVQSHTIISSVTYNKFTYDTLIKAVTICTYIALMLILHTFTYKYIQSSCKSNHMPIVKPH